MPQKGRTPPAFLLPFITPPLLLRLQKKMPIPRIYPHYHKKKQRDENGSMRIAADIHQPALTAPILKKPIIYGHARTQQRGKHPRQIKNPPAKPLFLCIATPALHAVYPAPHALLLLRLVNRLSVRLILRFRQRSHRSFSLLLFHIVYAIMYDARAENTPPHFPTLPLYHIPLPLSSLKK